MYLTIQYIEDSSAIGQKMLKVHGIKLIDINFSQRCKHRKESIFNLAIGTFVQQRNHRFVCPWNVLSHRRSSNVQ